MFQLKTCMLGFEHLKGVYEQDEHFQELYEQCTLKPWESSSSRMGTCSKGIRCVYLSMA